MSDEKEEEEVTEGEYNPSGGVPGHFADPQYGDKDPDDSYDAEDEAEKE